MNESELSQEVNNDEVSQVESPAVDDSNDAVSNDADQVTQETEEISPQEETVTLTKAELEQQQTATRRIAEKKAYRKAALEYEAKNANQTNVQPVQEPEAPIWNAELNCYIKPDSVKRFYAENGLDLNGNPLPPSQVQRQVKQADPVKQAIPKASDAVANQLIECNEVISDFQQVMKVAPIHIDMAEAAALDPNGIKNLYDTLKSNPGEILQIAQLSTPLERQQRIWELNKRLSANRSSNIVSKANAQPKALKSESKPATGYDYRSMRKASRSRNVWRGAK